MKFAFLRSGRGKSKRFREISEHLLWIKLESRQKKALVPIQSVLQSAYATKILANKKEHCQRGKRRAHTVSRFWKTSFRAKVCTNLPKICANSPKICANCPKICSENSRRLWLSEIRCWKSFPANFGAAGK